MKFFKIISLCIFFLPKTANGEELPVKFFMNGKIVPDVKFYLIAGTHGYSLPYINNELIIPDTVHDPYSMPVQVLHSP